MAADDIGTPLPTNPGVISAFQCNSIPRYKTTRVWFPLCRLFIRNRRGKACTVYARRLLIGSTPY